MTDRRKRTLGLASVLLTTLTLAADEKAAPPRVKIPEPGVPQIMTMEGRFVRAAYNNEGYVILGYRLANMSVGQPWLLLEVGVTVRDKVPSYSLTPAAVSLETPDGKTIPLPSNQEFREANLSGLQKQAEMIRDSINYFPPSANRACRIGFFADLDDRAMSYDRVELTPDRGCVGRLYFKIPGGLKHGQYFLNVKFPKSVVRVPFRIMTAEEEKFMEKNWKDIKKQVDEAFKKGK